MASTLRLFYHPVSQPSRSLLFFLNHNEIPFEAKMIDITKKEQKAPEYLEINPNGLVPAIVDGHFGDMKLYEVAAIMSHLCETRNKLEFYPSDPVLRATINQWMHWHHTNSRLATLRVFRPLVFDRNIEKATTNLEQLQPALQIMETQLKETPFLVGNHLSIADMLIVTELDQLKGLNFYDFAKYPSVAKWMDGMKQFPAYEKTYKDMVHIMTKALSKA